MFEDNEDTFYSLKDKISLEKKKMGTKRSTEQLEESMSPTFAVNNMPSEIFKKKTQSPTITTHRRNSQQYQNSNFKLETRSTSSMFEADELELELFSEPNDHSTESPRTKHRNSKMDQFRAKNFSLETKSYSKAAPFDFEKSTDANASTNSPNTGTGSSRNSKAEWLRSFRHRGSEDLDPPTTLSNTPPFDFATFRAGFQDIKFNFLNCTKQKVKSLFFRQKVYNIDLQDLLGVQYLVKSKYVGNIPIFAYKTQN
jgi:hypothetical protein